LQTSHNLVVPITMLPRKNPLRPTFQRRLFLCSASKPCESRPRPTFIARLWFISRSRRRRVRSRIISIYELPAPAKRRGSVKAKHDKKSEKRVLPFQTQTNALFVDEIR